MKNIRDCNIGDRIERYQERLWTDHVKGQTFNQTVTSVIEITQVHHNRIEYKTVEIIGFQDLCHPDRNLLDVTGGIAFRAFDRPTTTRDYKIL